MGHPDHTPTSLEAKGAWGSKVGRMWELQAEGDWRKITSSEPVRSWSYGSWGCLHKIHIMSSQPTLRQSQKGTSGVRMNVHCWQGYSHYKDPKGRMGAAEPSLSKAQRDSKAFLWSECGLRSYIQKVPTWSSPHPMLMAWRLLCYRDCCFQD